MDSTTQRENPLNVFIKESNVEKILKKYDVPIRVNDISHFQRAFVHRSYLKSSMNSHVKSKKQSRYRIIAMNDSNCLVIAYWDPS